MVIKLTINSAICGTTFMLTFKILHLYCSFYFPARSHKTCAFTSYSLRIHWVNFTHSLDTLYAFTGYTLRIYWVHYYRLLGTLPLMSNAFTSFTASRLLLHITRLLIFGVHSHITEYLIYYKTNTNEISFV